MNDAVPYSEEDQPDNLTPLEAAALEEEAEDQMWPPTIDSNAAGPVSVFESDSVSQGEIVRGLLEGEGMHAIFEQLSGISNTGGVILGDTFRGAVLVPPHEAARAKEIIDAFAAQPVTDEEIESASTTGPDGSVV